MSIVERALEKMQQASRVAATGKVPAPPSKVYAQVVETGEYRGPAVVPPNSGKILAINQAALRASGLLPPEHQERQIARQYRQIKRPLIANAIGRGVPPLANGRLIMVASAVPGEGKTFTAINLAFSMALEKDVRVLMVDADVAKPHISRLMGVSTELGLLDVLADPGMDVEHAVLPTDVPRLSMLPAGRRSDHATELLASARMEEVVNSIVRHDPGRIVIIDSPPLLLTTESHVLSHVAGQVVVVIRADKTPQRVVMDALSFLGDRPGVSLVLNQSVTEGSGGYYYGYGPEQSGKGV
jgi:exopolysaccharide/PEP-CTERM locus tyrosine autokinase